MDIYEIRKQLNEGKTLYDMPLRVTFYARVSTAKDEQINSLNNQISFYSDFIKASLNPAFFSFSTSASALSLLLKAPIWTL